MKINVGMTGALWPTANLDAERLEADLGESCNAAPQ
jgi:hypothetical protein